MNRRAFLDLVAEETSDDLLISAMLGRDENIAVIARQLFDRKHRDDPALPEPAHCSECFEGCPKCQPDAELMRRIGETGLIT